MDLQEPMVLAAAVVLVEIIRQMVMVPVVMVVLASL
tara:strand:+ start:1848 stop:1955 length:108 start_codon:yes stop_codon:yes gene_type:complete